MAEILREVERSDALRSFLRSRIPVGDGPGCFCCRLIVEDLESNDRLTGHPVDALGAGTYPVDGKILHLAVEFSVEQRIDGRSIKTVRDLLPFILRKLERKN